MVYKIKRKKTNQLIIQFKHFQQNLTNSNCIQIIKQNHPTFVNSICNCFRCGSYNKVSGNMLIGD